MFEVVRPQNVWDNNQLSLRDTFLHRGLYTNGLQILHSSRMLGLLLNQFPSAIHPLSSFNMVIFRAVLLMLFTVASADVFFFIIKFSRLMGKHLLILSPKLFLNVLTRYRDQPQASLTEYFLSQHPTACVFGLIPSLCASGCRSAC